MEEVVENAIIEYETPIQDVVEEVAPVEKKTVNATTFNIDKLAKAVAMHETKDCTLGYGKMYNNCFGIKNGGTVPCNRIGNSNMCIYNSPEESYNSFKIIRNRWYQGMPTLQKAKKWSGNDRANIWLKNVLYFYKN